MKTANLPAKDEGKLELLKTQLLEERLKRLEEQTLNSRLRHAANEAATLASGTGYPLLVFPALFEEKAEAALNQWDAQGSICRCSLHLVEV